MYFVTVPPRVLSGPEPFTVTRGENIEITCNITGIPPPEVMWFSAEQTITPGDRYDIITTTETTTLIIKESVVEDTTEYTLKLENPAGSDTFTVQVTVIGESQLLTIQYYELCNNISTIKS